jgi:signal transduction histidine kinase
LKGPLVVQRWRRSIKARLVLLFVALALCTAVVFLIGMQRLLAGGWQVYAKPMVADYVDRLAAEIGSPPDAAKAGALAERLPIAITIEGPRLQLQTHPHDRWRSKFGDDDEHRYESWGLARQTADGHRIEFAVRAPREAERPRLFGWITLALLLTLTAAAYLSVRRLLKPLESISAGVEAFGRGHFAAPIPIREKDAMSELGELSARINRMAANLHGMLDAKRGLLLAISHELRSPLTRARVNAELLDTSPEREALLRDLGEMRDLITTLLESERLAQGHAALQAEPTDVARLAAELAHDVDLPLELDLDRTLPAVNADPTRLRLLLRNLIDNARRHAGDAPRPALLFYRRQADGRLALGLRDHGPGVAPEQITQLGEAFHRPDSARTRAAGGVGLGLHLCRLVAQAHGGELRLRNAQPGLEVAMVWAAGSAGSGAPAH